MQSVMAQTNTKYRTQNATYKYTYNYAGNKSTICFIIDVNLHVHTLCARRHDLTLSRGSHRLINCNFVVRQVFEDSY